MHLNAVHAAVVAVPSATCGAQHHLSVVPSATCGAQHHLSVVPSATCGAQHHLSVVPSATCSVHYHLFCPTPFAVFITTCFDQRHAPQVHGAVLRDGREIAMKVQYPGVARSIESDVDNLLRLISVANVLPRGLYIENAAAVSNNRGCYHRECSSGKQQRGCCHRECCSGK